MKRRLIIVSNREPYIHEKTADGIRYRRTIGGLVSALDKVMQSCGGEWIAWGSGSADFVDGGEVLVPPGNPKYKLRRIKLSETEERRYYRGFSNEAMWPIFHLFPGRARFVKEDWEYYKTVNAKFAKTIIESAGGRGSEPDDMVWIQDYHLSLVPQFVRGANKSLKLVFFWHIPWVNWEMFSKLPWRAEILNGLLGSDLIGFNAKSYVRHFIECAERLGLNVDRKNGLIIKDRHTTKVKAFPIGIDCNVFKSLPSAKLDYFKRQMNAEHIILSIERLDYNKGIPHKLLAFERFLQKYPEFIGKVVLFLLISPSRTRVEEYRKLKREIDENVGRINGLFQRMDWIPIRYFYRSTPQEGLLRVYGVSDIALITPIKDGLNLIAKEYISARKDGVLILSEFAGVAEQLKEAIIVNPYNIEGVADAIKFALELSPRERKERFRALERSVKEYDINWWLNRFMEEWEKIYEVAT